MAKPDFEHIDNTNDFGASANVNLESGLNKPPKILISKGMDLNEICVLNKNYFLPALLDFNREDFFLAAIVLGLPP